MNFRLHDERVDDGDGRGLDQGGVAAEDPEEGDGRQEDFPFRLPDGSCRFPQVEGGA